MGAVDTLGKRKAFEDLKKIDGGSWAWGQRALTRISELRTLANLMARLAGNENQDAATLAEDARQHLRVAKESIEPPDGGSSRRTSGWVDRVVTNTNAAACLIIRFAPLREVQAMLPDLVAHRRRTASRRAASDQRDLDTLRGPGRPCSPQAANWGTDRSARAAANAWSVRPRSIQSRHVRSDRGLGRGLRLCPATVHPSGRRAGAGGSPGGWRARKPQQDMSARCSAAAQLGSAPMAPMWAPPSVQPG